MGFEVGRCYVFDAVSYPRYRYFQQRLCQLIPRWQRIMDAGGLPDCVSHGRDKMKKILQSVEQLGSEISISVFGDNDPLRRSETDLPVKTKTSYRKRTFVTLDSHLHMLKAQSHYDDFKPVITVILVTSLSYDKTMKSLDSMLSGLSRQQFESFIISVTDSNMSYIYSDLLTQNADSEKAKPSVKDVHEGSAHLAKRIQYVLETKAVTILEQIIDYLKAFSLSTRGDQQTLFLANIMKKSLRDPFVVKDISPYPKEGVVLTDRMPEDTELRLLSSAVGSGWESLGPPLGLSPSDISMAKSSSSDMHEQIYSMLLTWKNKDPTDTLTYLLQVLEHSSSVISISTDVIKELKQKTDKRPIEMTKTDKDKKFQKNLLEFVAKSSKCALVDEFSRQYGISASLINEFLNDEYFGYEKKVEKVAHDVGLPSWPEDSKDCGVRTCCSFTDSLSCKLDPLLNDVENYMKQKHWMLVLAKRLQFELFGLLKQTVVPTTVYTPDIPKLPKNMQKDLLELPDVYGCGTIWGELVVHFLTPISHSAETEIKNILSSYSYRHPYTSQLVEPCREQAGGYIPVEQGTSIRVKKRTDETQAADTATSSKDDGYNYSTLGCFVKIKPSAPSAENVSAEDIGKLYAVTCAHCLKDFDPQVEAFSGTIYTTLGRKAHDIYEPEAIDIAVVEVADDALSTCETALKDFNGEQVSKWQFYEGPLSLGLPVYKRGSQSKLTRGVCTCADYQFKKIFELNKKLEKQNLPLLDSEYNILISPLPANRGVPPVIALESQDQEMSEEQRDGSDTGQPAGSDHQNNPGQENNDSTSRKGYFSKPGDSGSVVCKDEPRTKIIQVVSLLHGTLSVPAENEAYSYSSSMLKTVKKLEKTKSCTITPATNH